ncbi:hypothetical protein [Rathayibacter sp. AY1D9]|uniref:hypothetical protein n=1 Tax=Rathayibacter sp. AY1D9 TaxID=2080548 RepID=UPI000CE8E082|nr:hypothetical protein [Rathayibacter sp. AY1D9]PPH84889.1 hypothetical protein C5C50_00945 [Rathayibacter sp. AY1D9]
MTDYRPAEQKLIESVVKLKRERNQARALVAELRADTIREACRGRLRRLEDFAAFVGVDRVLTTDGRIDLAILDRELTSLLRRRPELAAPPADERLAG